MRVPGQSSDNNKAALKGVDGLNNKLDPMRGRPSSQGVAPRTWQLLSEADNINITDANLMVRRDGYEPFIPARTSPAPSRPSPTTGSTSSTTELSPR